MYLILTASKDTYITNKIINNSFSASDANVGAAGTLDLFKMYNESTLANIENPIELSKILLKFDLGQLKNLHSQGKIDLNSSNFKASVKLHDVYGGQTTPNNFRLICRPLAKSFDEGSGRDVVTFSDIGNANFVTASYTNGTVVAWNTPGASTSGSLGDNNIDVINSGTLGSPAGDAVVTNLGSEQFFVTGEEDLDVDVTNAISGTITNQITDHGFIIEYSGSYAKDSKTYFVKRFASRDASRSDILPKLVIKYDDSIIDNHSNFTFGMSGSLFLHNFHRNLPSNILSGALGTEIQGENSLLLILTSGSVYSGTFFRKTVTASQHQLGNNYQTGIYSASFAISQFSASWFGDPSKEYLNRETRNGSLQNEINSAGSASFTAIWSSLDEKVGFHTGSLVIKSPFRSTKLKNSKRYLLTVKNLKDRYRSNDVANIEIFVENRDKNIVFVKTPLETKSEVFNNIHYQVRDTETRKIIIPFDTNFNSTRLSSDQGGMSFNLYMQSLPSGKNYELEFLIKDFSNDIFFQNVAAKFVVD